MQFSSFSSISGLYSLGVSSTSHPVVTTKNTSRHCHVSTGEKNNSQWRSTVLDVGECNAYDLFLL